MYDKLVVAGNISSLGVMCYIISQLWYNGMKIVQFLRLREFKTSISTILWALCCRVAAFMVSPKYAQVARQ